MMKTGCTRRASCLSVTGDGAPHTVLYSVLQCRGKNKVRRRRRRSPCLAFVIAMADDDNVVDRPTQLICILDFYVNRQIQKTKMVYMLVIMMPIML